MRRGWGGWGWGGRDGSGGGGGGRSREGEGELKAVITWNSIHQLPEDKHEIGGRKSEGHQQRTERISTDDMQSWGFLYRMQEAGKSTRAQYAITAI